MRNTLIIFFFKLEIPGGEDAPLPPAGYGPDCINLILLIVDMPVNHVQVESETDMEMISQTEQQQNQRTILRERFLRLLTSLQEVETCFILHGNMKVVANFGSTDLDIQHIQVSNLKTPLGEQPSALLRTSDIISYNMTLPETMNPS